MRQGWKRIVTGTLCAALCAGNLSGMTGNAEETEAALGRYLEADVALPDELFARDIERMADGSLAVVGEIGGPDGDGCAVYRSEDGGATWEQAYTLSQEAGGYVADIKLSPQGGGAGIRLEEMSLEENTVDETAEAAEGTVETADGEESSTDASMFDMKYTFFSFDESGAVQERELADNDLRMLEFTREGELAGLTYEDGAVLLDPVTGEYIGTIAEAFANMLGICGEEALLLMDEEVQRYDIHTGEPLSRDDALNDALYAGEAAQMSGYLQTSSIGYSILFSQDEEGRLYYCTNNGIFSHMMEGSVVEQVVEGSLSSLSAPSLSLQSMAVVGQAFYVLASEDGVTMKLFKYEFDPDIPSVPEHELAIYSLRENQTLRQAIVAFQKKYPDTYIDYRVGMSGTDGVTAADALRTLNTDILAGNGPDVLALDGMSVETYASQGILTDLTKVIEEIKGTDGFLENITEAYRTEDGVLAAIPTRFSMEVAAGFTEQLEGIGGFESFIKLAETPNGMGPFDVTNLAQILYPVCAGSWENEDGTINQEKLAEFVNGVKNISDTYRAAASEEALEQLAMYEDGTYAYWEDLYGIEMNSLAYGLMDFLAGTAQVKAAAIGSIVDYAGLLSVETDAGTCGMKLLSMQEENVFYPSTVLGILSTAKEQERAAQFVTYMLSAEGQSAYADIGFPVNLAAFEKLLSEKQFEDGTYGMSSSDSEGNMIDLTYRWPEQEEMDALREMAQTVNTCADTESVKKEAVFSEMQRCLTGEITADEAVNAIMQKLNLYLAE